MVTTAPNRTILCAAVVTRVLADELRVDSGNRHSGTEAINLTPVSPMAVCCRLVPPLDLPAAMNSNRHPLQESL